VRSFVCPRCGANSTRHLKKLLPPVLIPNSFGSCVEIITSPAPTLKPLRTVSEMKLTVLPRRTPRQGSQSLRLVPPWPWRVQFGDLYRPPCCPERPQSESKLPMSGPQPYGGRCQTPRRPCLPEGNNKALFLRAIPRETRRPAKQEWRTPPVSIRRRNRNGATAFDTSAPSEGQAARNAVFGRSSLCFCNDVGIGADAVTVEGSPNYSSLGPSSEIGIYEY
jgi:hypothetical protein